MDCEIIERVRFGTQTKLRPMCPRCRLAYRFEDVGADPELWAGIVARIEATGEPFPP